MALYKDPKTEILRVIAEENDLTLVPEDYDLINPLPASPPDGSSATYNTVLTVRANNVAAAYQGEYEFYYNRLDIADLAAMVPFQIQSPDVSSTHGVIKALNRRFSTNFTPEDLDDIPSVDMGGYYEVIVRAAAGSLGWVGEATLTITEGGIELSDYFTEAELSGLPYPTPYASKTFAVMYSYWRDVSAHYDYLSTLSTGDSITAEMVALLNDVTGDPWQATGYADYSLGNAVIEYAGPTTPEVVANTEYDFVVIIALSVDDCQAMTGELILHFNAPEPDTVV